jgi:hypothetical protein
MEDYPGQEQQTAVRQGRCRSCNAPIVWVKLVQTEKWHICNPPVKMFVLHASPTYGDRYELRDAYESHFATCPDADKWRKKHEEKNP